MTDDRQRLLTKVPQETGQIGEKILVLIAPARARPFAIPMATQIDRHCVLDRQTPGNQRHDKIVPASSLVAHAVDKNESFLLGIAPLPIVKFKSIVIEVMVSEFQIHRPFVAAFRHVSETAGRAVYGEIFRAPVVKRHGARPDLLVKNYLLPSFESFFDVISNSSS
jgi:hypothetical protein